MTRRHVAYFFALLLLAGCSPLVTSWGDGSIARRNDPPLPRGVEAISLLGDTLRTIPLSMETRRRYEQQLAQARAAYERAPADPDSIIWYGRRMAYLGHFREAIGIFSRGIALHPYDARFYRHRGHRYISVRELNNAIVDFERAARLMEGRPDTVEPDGQPNAQNRPIGTLRSNIYYHLGLAHYLKGDFARAIPIYRRELQIASNDDRRVSVAHWYYMSLRRLGRAIEATQFLRPFRRDMDVIENQAYHRLMLMYKGELPVDSLLPGDTTARPSVQDVTVAYGVANWHLYNGRREEAERLLRRIIASRQWGAFGYIAAEAELARMGYGPPPPRGPRPAVAPVWRAP